MSKENRKIWEGRDEQPYQSPVSAELYWVEDQGVYNLAFEEGPFSGYPSMNLTREKLEEWYQKVGKELYPDGHPGICGDRIESLFRKNPNHQFHTCMLPPQHPPVEAAMPTHKCGCGCEWVRHPESARP